MGRSPEAMGAEHLVEILSVELFSLHRDESKDSSVAVRYALAFIFTLLLLPAVSIVPHKHVLLQLAL